MEYHEPIKAYLTGTTRQVCIIVLHTQVLCTYFILLVKSYHLKLYLGKAILFQLGHQLLNDTIFAASGCAFTPAMGRNEVQSATRK